MNKNMSCHVSKKNINGKIKCQFGPRFKSNFQYDGKQWCIFHLPIDNNVGCSVDAKLTDQFNNSINEVIEKAFFYGKKLDFSYVIFPKNLEFVVFNMGNSPIDPNSSLVLPTTT